MRKQNIVQFKNVTKSYRIGKHKYSTFADKISGFINKKATQEKFFAIKSLNLEIRKGSTVGIIGKNGSGKSTILKLISKIIYPDSGLVLTAGRVGAFIELGAGLHPELTGRENIFLYGSILGMTRKQISERFQKIVDFAEIHKFLDVPIKRYSSGMYSRLGFSVCSFCDPDILLVDEVLAVGDSNFQAKCLAKMQSFAKSEKTVVFVSHDLEAIKKICSTVILLDHGRAVMTGSAKKVIGTYLDKYASGSLE